VKTAAVLYVRHLEQMRTFYEACFGMEATESAKNYCVLESGPWTLSLVVAPAQFVTSVDRSGSPGRRADVAIKLAFGVASIRDLRPLVAQLGGVVDHIDTEWDFGEWRHCDGTDVEGNVIQFLEPLAAPR
jgi:catechol-2,3-dioxygenase